MMAADCEGALTTKVLRDRRAEPSFMKPGRGVYLRLMRTGRYARKAWGGLRNPRVEQHDEPPITEVKPLAGVGWTSGGAGWYV